MSANILEPVDKTKMIKVIISVVIPIFIFLIPVTDVFTSDMRTFLALTAWMLLWAAFEITDLLVPSLLWPVLLIILGIIPETTIYNSWLSLVIPCCMAAMVLAAILQRIGYWRD